MPCICWAAWNGCGQLMLWLKHSSGCADGQGTGRAAADEPRCHPGWGPVSASSSSSEEPGEVCYTQESPVRMEPSACSSQCLRDCVKSNCMLDLTIAVTWKWFWPPQIPWKSCVAPLHLVTKKSCLKTHHSSSLKNSELLLLFNPLFLPCHIPFAVAVSQVLLLGLPLFRYGQSLVLVWSTNIIPFTHADINFFLSFHWSVQYMCTLLHAIIFLLLSESSSHLMYLETEMTLFY